MTTMNPMVLLGVGALGLVGCLILLYVGLQMLRDERAKKDTSATGTPAVKPTPAMPARSPGGAHEVLRVLRDNLTGRLVIEIAGRRYASLHELADPALSAGLRTTLNDLQAFTETAALPPGEPAATPPPSAGVVAPPPPAASVVVPPLSAAPVSRPPAPSASPPPLPPPTMNPFKQMQVLRDLAKNPPPEPKSITEQVNDVLQAQILGTPLAERQLRMRTGARGEAQFDLDGASYPSVEAVPDLEGRAALKAAIAAWERTQ